MEFDLRISPGGRRLPLGEWFFAQEYIFRFGQIPGGLYDLAYCLNSLSSCFLRGHAVSVPRMYVTKTDGK